MANAQTLQRTPEWFKARLGRITASRVGAILGLGHFTTRAQVMAEMVEDAIRDRQGLPPLERLKDNPAIKWGQDHEGDALDSFERKTGKLVLPAPSIQHPKYDWISASPDGLVDADEQVEVKCPYKSQYTEASPEYLAQMQLQLSTTGRRLCWFVIWREGQPVIVQRVPADPQWLPRVLPQLEAFMAEYRQRVESGRLPEPEPPKLTAGPVEDLPLVTVTVTGSLVVKDNFDRFEAALRHFVGDVLIRDPQTDQDFVDLDAQVKTLKKAEAALEQAGAQVIGQVDAVNLAIQRKDLLQKLARDNRLLAEKLVRDKKQAIRDGIVMEAREAFLAYCGDLNGTLTGVRLPQVPFDPAAAMHGLKTLSSIREAVEGALAKAKAEASDLSRRLLAGCAIIDGAHNAGLFADRQTLALLPPDELKSVVEARVAKDNADRAALVQAAVERGRQEAEQAAAVAAQEAKQLAEATAFAEADFAATKATNAANRTDPLEPPPVRRTTPIRKDAPAERLSEIKTAFLPLVIDQKKLSLLGFEPLDMHTETRAVYYAAGTMAKALRKVAAAYVATADGLES